MGRFGTALDKVGYRMWRPPVVACMKRSNVPLRKKNASMHCVQVSSGHMDVMEQIITLNISGVGAVLNLVNYYFYFYYVFTMTVRSRKPFKVKTFLFDSGMLSKVREWGCNWSCGQVKKMFF